MKEQVVKAFVTKADGNYIRVKLLDSSFSNEILNIGLSYDNNFSEYVIQIAGNLDKALVFGKLRDIDVSFSSGKEWCPSEVFEFLREEGLVSGQFKRISWTNPASYQITVN